MIITLKDTTTIEVASRLDRLRDEAGSGARGRVLTLLVVVREAIDVDRAIEISEAASREHPCRVIVVVEGEDAGSARLNAQIRVGGSAGPSEVVVLEPRGEAGRDLDTLVMPLLLSDTPVVTYWPNEAPDNPGQHPLGRLAVRRITDSRATDCPVSTLRDLSLVHTPGDTDLAWSGVTLWRALLATIVSGLPSHPVGVHVTGNATHPSSYLVALWLRRQLQVPVTHEVDPEALTITGVHFTLEDSSTTSLTRSASSTVAHLDRTGLVVSDVNLPRRSVQDCLMEELRRLDPDVFYGRLISEDLAAFAPVTHQLRELA
ncbi:glucose-6-phosphate dehydrogenase assembly protein OpcA [Schaalia sp. 19OD2882]|uniref:glucose-6-phosphate dehydrogenase assembly protein OpcA n=1 Tax=Schaalia sp. 19OD2882 TaxID=2794089 RepID=UPI001C1EF074|nr:glucose-6-phosphate dehydrogenase assembly protein OpcA [Schaalia sp. 19OD2882]QWW20541.1 glucose-6-phosphate dehydrogenase assembly protein OpcA [Schaalia sp. 19OD2882]